MKFQSISIQSWKQFERISLDFHPSVTILTGANGSGKTTVLGMLSRFFGWPRVELLTPIQDEETGSFQWFSKLFFKHQESFIKIGEIKYDSGSSDLRLPKQNSPQYEVQITNQTSFQGINIPSHRPIYNYQPVPHISTQKRTKNDAYNLVRNSNLQRQSNSHSQSSNFFIKETLLSWAIGGSGNEFIVEDSEMREHFLGFERVLKKILPDNLGFKKISVRAYEIVLETESGDFMLDAVSGGMGAIIDLAWQIYNCQRDEAGELVVLIDEIENHLHPSMQRRIIPDLVSAFPKTQFIVSTHSPLVVGSSKNSRVYAFTYNEELKVVSHELDLVNKAQTATKILNDVLGVPVTMPIWAESELERILTKYRHSQRLEDDFPKIRQELLEAGLGDYFPDTLVNLAGDVK